MLQIESTGHNTEQGSGSGLPLRIGGIRFGEQGSGLPQPNMVGTDVTAAVTGWPGQKRTGKSKTLYIYIYNFRWLNQANQLNR